MAALRYDARIYDALHADRTADVAWYLKQARKAQGPVLELGAGTGRVVLPLARAGIAVSALEPAAEMRAALRRRLTSENPQTRARVSITAGDMTQFNLADRFALIQIPFRSFLHNTTQEARRACLARCFAHLLPGGRLAFDVFQPSDAYMDRFSGVFEGVARMDDPIPLVGGGFLLMTEWNDFDREQRIVASVQRYELTDAAGRIRESRVQILTLALIYPDDLCALLREAGFVDIVIAGGFEDEPPGPEAVEIVILASRPKE